ncbi:MAG: twin-arginine translocase subunit TatC [Caldithrix sp.]|nr:MAG: twin-arginine translocase subunit TatC [Caldithrix sp.]TDI97807.1 MAG: twin-arginine translocase subunit TatC [Caldithrix sp.]
MTEKSKEKEMPFLDHLEELRWRLIKSIVTVIVCAIGVYFFSEQVLAFLIAPYNDAAPQGESGAAQKLIFLSPTGGFMIRIKISIFSAIFLGLPVIFYQIWQFVVPGLLGKEKKLVPVVAFFSTLCFLTGAFFCYFVVLRFGLRFLLSFETEDLVATISVNEYLGFITMLILVFGFIFELPMLAFFLTKIGFLTPAFMRHYRRHGIVGMVILSAIVTPPDVFTQLLLAGPLILLYEISILISAAVHKKQEVA